MSTQTFIQDLVDLLFRLSKGMLEFDDPPPKPVKEGVMQAVIGFGDQALASLHQRIMESPGNAGHYVIDVLGKIGHPSSVPYIIEVHQHADYITATAAIAALRKIKAEVGYLYIGELLLKKARGDKYVFQSNLEYQLCCQALADWKDSKAVELLRRIIHSNDPDGEMPIEVIKALTITNEGMKLLHELAQQESALQEVIDQVLLNQENRQLGRHEFAEEE